MSDLQVQRALALLRRAGAAGPESAAATGDPRERADALAEQASDSLRLAATGERPAIGAVHAQCLKGLIDEGRGALKQLAADPEHVSLSSSQMSGLEAIVRLTGRPSLPVGEDGIQPTDGDWSERMTIAAERIQKSAASVGRLNIAELGGAQGTAFMVAKDLALTNRHVAITFAELRPNRWAVGTGLHPTVDFLAQRGSAERREHEVTDIVAIHSNPRVDMAVLRLAPTSTDGTAELPPPLLLNSDKERITPGANVYAIGYPDSDPDNPLDAINAIFGAGLSIKRVAPGEIIGPRADGIGFTHDCSTLKGSSGSCVVQFGTHLVLGLHYSGMFKEENRAVSLAHVMGDPIVSGNNLNFLN